MISRLSGGAKSGCSEGSRASREYATAEQVYSEAAGSGNSGTAIAPWQRNRQEAPNRVWALLGLSALMLLIMLS
jgi:hypothetical protein